MSRHDLLDYKQAIKQSKEIPKILKCLDDFYKKLYTYKDYLEINDLLWKIEEIKLYYDVRLYSSNRILKKKGKIDE
jgi:hypothetical protein